MRGEEKVDSAGQVGIHGRREDDLSRGMLKAHLPRFAEPGARAVHDDLLAAPDHEQIAGGLGGSGVAVGGLGREVGRDAEGLGVARLRERDGASFGGGVFELVQGDGGVCH